MSYLITGGCGFMGSNLGEHVLRRSEPLVVFDNLSRLGASNNLAWLKTLGAFEFVHGDIRSYDDIERVVVRVKPAVIFHLAGQVAMTTSVENPRLDFDINAMGTLNLLEAVRKHSPESIIVYSSTNKVYGDLENLHYQETDLRYLASDYSAGFDEQLPLDFSTPYGTSKGSADQYVKDYAKTFGLRTVVFRHSSAFGERQFSTFDQGWIGWFVQKALETKYAGASQAFTISGNGKQVRDVLFSSDLVACYFSAARYIDEVCGQVFNIGGGMNNSLSLLELFAFLEKTLDVQLNYQQLPWRKSDQKVFVADIAKAEKRLKWSPKVDKYKGIQKMIEWAKNQHG